MNLPPNTGISRGRGRGLKRNEDANRGLGAQLVSPRFLI